MPPTKRRGPDAGSDRRVPWLAGAAGRQRRGVPQQSVRIGVILPFSGQFADTGVQLDDGIKLYMQQHGDTVAGKKIEVIRKDVGGIAPEVAKRLAQELVVRDNVDILAGFALTPNALAAADVSAQAKKFMVVMNAATSIITTKSPYLARTFGHCAADRRIIRRLGCQERCQDGVHSGLRLWSWTGCRSPRSNARSRRRAGRS